METKYAGIFIQAFHTVLGSVTSKHIVSTDIHKPFGNADTHDISVMIGMVGDINGQVFLSMNSKVGQTLASDMMGGMEIAEADELVISAVSELCNMIMGNACSSICTDARQVDIMPPIILTENNNAKISYNISFLLENHQDIDFAVMI
jgi:chemotaxis protein CheX